jgi:hypothetical protein
MRILEFLRDTAIDLCLGCRHDRTTRPFTIQDESYMVCLDCGKQLFYSVESMRRLSGRELRDLRARRGDRLTVLAEPATAATHSSDLAA